MITLGIGGYSHDSAAAIVVDGEVVAAVAEERLSRVKHQGGVPHRAIQYCLETAGVSAKDVDHVGVYMRPGLRVSRRMLYRALNAWRHPLYSLGFMGYEVLHNAQYIYGMRRALPDAKQFHCMHHHPAHGASAFLVSPYDRAALLSIDYIGEWDCTWTGVGSDTHITPLRAAHYPNSLGVFYSALTDYLGFLRASDEYKVMGLAAYGEPEYYDDFAKIVRAGGDGWYRIDHSWTAWHYAAGSRTGYFSEKFLKRFGTARKKGEPVTKHHENIAASAQKVLEDRVLELCGWLRERTGEENLCFAGGVALNCAMNGRLLREGPFKNIWVQPAAGDDGIAIGAAMQLYHQQSGKPRAFQMRHAYLGPDTQTEEGISDFLTRTKTKAHRPEDLEGYVADLLAQGAIVGWYQGRMEFGPRALGSRSILADPTRADMKDLLNKYVKYREEFRPFAPIVIEEAAGDYFEGCDQSPFMLFVYNVPPEVRDRLPAITHVDGTARVQTVSRETSPRLYRLLERFAERRGVPVLVNTSFNVMGEPIVNTPSDALRCFASCGMDALVMEDWVIEK